MPWCATFEDPRRYLGGGSNRIRIREITIPIIRKKEGVLHRIWRFITRKPKPMPYGKSLLPYIQPVIPQGSLNEMEPHISLKSRTDFSDNKDQVIWH